MNRALFAGLSGTVAFQSRLDVVGNNIANSNTVGYKEGRVTFQDALYETLEGGRSGQTAGTGGSNPIQIGSGVTLGGVSVQHEQGSLERTGQPLDAAISGPGMLMVSDAETSLYTRDGSFTLDDTNTLVADASGLRVMGWMASDGAIETSGPVSELSFDIGELAPVPKAFRAHGAQLEQIEGLLTNPQARLSKKGGSGAVLDPEEESATDQQGEENEQCQTGKHDLGRSLHECVGLRNSWGGHSRLLGHEVISFTSGRTFPFLPFGMDSTDWKSSSILYPKASSNCSLICDSTLSGAFPGLQTASTRNRSSAS